MSLPATEMLVGEPYTKPVRITSIRNLAADVHVETISDDEIEIIAIRKDTKVFDLTENSTWSETDAKFPLVIDASNCYTAVELLRGFADSQSLTEADTLELKADELIKQLNDIASSLTITPDILKTAGFNCTPNGTFI